MKSFVIAIFVFLGFSACGLRGPAQTIKQSQVDTDATVFAVWTEEAADPSQTGLMQLDFKTLSISTSTQTALVRLSTGENCRCSAIFSGSNERGSIAVSRCQSSMGFVTIECTGFDGAKQYSVTDSKLNFCSVPRGSSVVRCSSLRE